MRYLELIDDVVGLDKVGDRTSIFGRLRDADPKKVFSLAAALPASLPAPTKKEEPFRFVANTRYSGLPYPCSDSECRMTSLLQAANFGALYANEITLFNPLQPAEWELRRLDEPLDFLEELSFGLSAILALRPIIDRGICTFINNKDYTFCHSCYSKGLSGAFSNDIDVFFQLARDFYEYTTITYNGTFEGQRSFSIQADEERLGHDVSGGQFSTGKPLPKKLRRGSILPKGLALEMGLANSFAYYSANDLVQANSVASKFGHDSLWSSSPHISLIKKFFGEPPN